MIVLDDVRNAYLMILGMSLALQSAKPLLHPPLHLQPAAKQLSSF